MTASAAFEDIVENFSLFDDWEDRYRYVIDMGKELPDLDEAKRSSVSKVEGCASQVWLVPSVQDDRLFFEGDSDAMIVRGLIAILIALVSGRTLDEIRSTDIRAQLERLELGQALSAQRSNGLRAMVGRIEDIARGARAA